MVGQGREKIKIARLYDLHIYNESLMVHLRSQKDGCFSSSSDTFQSTIWCIIKLNCCTISDDLSFYEIVS